MPNYEYKCDNCSHGFEQIQGFHDKALRKCPACKKLKLYRVISILYASVKGEPTTVYHQAARNTEKMGKYELETKRKRDYGQADDVKTPWYRKDRDVNLKLNKLDKQQKKDYIQKGILPNDKYKPAARKTGL